MKPNKEAIEAYKALAKESPARSMKEQIIANLKATCDKFAGNEDKIDGCIGYLTECAREILNGKNGDVDDEVCFRICRDYFNDELWKKEAKAKKAKAEERRESEEEKDAPAVTPKAPEKTPEQLLAEKNRAIVEENNKKLGIGLARTIDLFAGAV